MVAPDDATWRRWARCETARSVVVNSAPRPTVRSKDHRQTKAKHPARGGSTSHDYMGGDILPHLSGQGEAKNRSKPAIGGESPPPATATGSPAIEVGRFLKKSPAMSRGNCKLPAITGTRITSRPTKGVAFCSTQTAGAKLASAQPSPRGEHNGWCACGSQDHWRVAAYPSGLLMVGPLREEGVTAMSDGSGLPPI